MDVASVDVEEAEGGSSRKEPKEKKQCLVLVYI